MEKVKGFCKNYYLISLVILVILGFYLRFTGIFKPEGLWTDEMVSYNFAHQSFPFGILDILYHKEFQPPFWYLFLHIWMKVFGEGDFWLRFSSLIFGVSLIPVMYLVGKEYSSRLTGLIAAIITAINSMLIYYSQEVRLYSMLVLFGALSILFLIKIKNNPNKLNYCGYILSNTALIYTGTIGIMFLLYEVVLFSIYLLFKDTKRLKAFILAQLITIILYLPYLTTAITHINQAVSSDTSPFHWYKYNPADIHTLFLRWFTPAFNYASINVPHFAFGGISEINIAVFIAIPMIFYLIGIFKSASKNSFAPVLFFTAVLLILTQIILAKNGMFPIRSRYTILAMPIFILLTAEFLSSIKSRLLLNSLIALFITVNIGFILMNPMSAPKLSRDDPYKLVSDVLEKFPLGKKDILAMVYNGKLIYKYYDKTSLLPIDVDAITIKNPVMKEIFRNEELEKLNKNNLYEGFAPYIKSSEAPELFRKYFKKTIYDRLEEGRYLAIVLSLQYFYYDYQLKQILSSEEKYREFDLFPLFYSRLNHYLLNEGQTHLKPVLDITSGPWEVVIFQKKSGVTYERES